VPEYRLYPLGLDGRVGGAPEEFFAASDETAINHALSKRHLHGSELWDGARLVVMVERAEGA